MKKARITTKPFFTLWLLICTMLLPAALSANTRWSATHLIPTADFLGSGQFAPNVQLYMYTDTSGVMVPRPAFLVDYGIMEWVNVSLGYAGGFTLGFKGRLLNESGEFVPSIAIGGHNLFTHTEANWFGVNPTDSGVSGLGSGEFYLALGKTVEIIKTRFHLGIQSIPGVPSEMIGPFIGIEKYFGAGLYATVEFNRRHEEFNQALFLSWRLFNKKLEISAGVVGITKMLMNENNEFEFSLAATPKDVFVKPGIFVGLRYQGGFSFGNNEGLQGLDERVESHYQSIRRLRTDLDSLKLQLELQQKNVVKLSHAVTDLGDSMAGGKDKMRAIILEKLIVLNTLYATEPFDPEKTKQVTAELISFRERAVGTLQDVILDKKENKFLRLRAISILGQIGNKAAAELLLNAISQTEDPDLKIEIIIALGRLRETRASYLFEQLASDPNEAVALTAQEVLQKLQKETGMRFSKTYAPRPLTVRDTSQIPDTKIETGRGVKIEPPTPIVAADTLSSPPVPAIAPPEQPLAPQVPAVAPAITDSTTTAVAAPATAPAAAVVDKNKKKPTPPKKPAKPTEKEDGNW